MSTEAIKNFWASVVGKVRNFSFTAWWERNAGRPMNKKDKIFLGVLIVIFLFVFYVVLDANKYPALVKVVGGEGKVGVNPTDTALDFGDLAKGVTAVRRVNLKNGTPIPMFVIAVKTGKISELVKIDKNYFRLAPNSETKMEFSTYIPASANVDQYYKGRVYLFKIPTFGL